MDNAELYVSIYFGTAVGFIALGGIMIVGAFIYMLIAAGGN